MEYKDLRNKTIFDLCDDPAVLNEILAGRTKEHYLRNTVHHPDVIPLGMLEVADLTNNRELREAVLKEFEKEINAVFNE